MKNRHLIGSLLLFLFLAGCAGRLPSSSRSAALTKRHFNKYARKYKESAFGRKKVANVEILETSEVHRKLATVVAFVTMSDSDVHKVRMTFEKGPFGWRYVYWENLSGVDSLARDKPDAP